MVTAWRLMMFGCQGCFAHRLEKVSGVFFECPGHEDTMAKARQLAGHYKHSSQAKKALVDLGKVTPYTPHLHTHCWHMFIYLLVSASYSLILYVTALR